MSYFEGYQQTLFFNPDTLCIPGVTEAYDVYTINYLSTRNYTLFVTVRDIDTNVVVRLDGSLDGTTFAALISNTITENGTYAYNVSGFPVRKLRGNFLAEAGGNNARITFQIAAN
jgi:hypothetical protein